MNPSPITRAMLASFLKAATDALSPDMLLKFLSIAVSPYLITARYSDGPDGGAMFWVVATNGQRLLLYDDVEEYFSTGVLDDDGILRRWYNWNEDRIERAMEEIFR